MRLILRYCGTVAENKLDINLKYKNKRCKVKKILIGLSTKQNPKEAVLELKEKFNDNNVKAITFFASFNYEPAELIAAMNENFPNIQVFGCSTAGEIISGQICADSIVAMAFTDEVFEDIKIEVVSNLNADANLQPAIESFENHYSTPLSLLDNKKYFGLIYIDGLSKKEEYILDKLGEHTNVVFIGGSAGNDFNFYDMKTIIYANGKYYENSAVLALIKSKVDFGFEMVQNFELTEHKVIATKVDEVNRIIYELDNKSAVATYSEILKIPASAIENSFLDYSFALMADNQLYVRSVRQTLDNSFELDCNVKQGMQLSIVKTRDIIANTKHSLEEIKKKYRSISGMLLFNCVKRYIELEVANKSEEYAKLFSDIPTVGFNTYGESFIGHINRTAAILVLG